MSVSREDVFKRAVAKRKVEKEEKESKSNYEFEDREKITWAGLEYEKDKVYRFVGFPAPERTEPWHSKAIYFSKIVNDKGKGNINCVWPQTEDGKVDKDWLLYRLYDEIRERVWEEYSDGKKDKDGKTGKWVYLHEHTDVYKRTKRNRVEGKDEFDKPFFPSRRVCIPVIDRNDSWCVKNKHTKILTARVTIYKKENVEIVYADVGVPYGGTEMCSGLYVPLCENLVDVLGDWEKYDVVIKRIGNTSYRITHGDDVAISQVAKDIVVKEGLTKAEQTYEHFNLDTEYQDCSYAKLNYNLKKLFKDTDEQLNTNFSAELKERFEKEKAKKTKVQVVVSDEELDDIPPVSEMGKVKETPVETPVETVVETVVDKKVESEKKARRTMVVKSETNGMVDQCVKYFKSWDNLTDAEKELMVKSIEKFDENNVPVYLNTELINRGTEVLPCPQDDCFFEGTEKTTEQPIDILHCVSCGVKFE